MFQKRKYFNVLKIIEEGIKQGGLIHGIDHVHFVAMKKVVCNLAIIPLGGMPEKSFAECVLVSVHGFNGSRFRVERRIEPIIVGIHTKSWRYFPLQYLMSQGTQV